MLMQVLGPGGPPGEVLGSGVLPAEVLHPGLPSAEEKRKKNAGPIVIDSETHRQLIGWTGLFLPIILLAVAWRWPTPSLPTKLGSLSAYYYTSAVAALEGILVLLAVFLLTYTGHPKGYKWIDRVAAWIAAGAAMSIAACPTYPPKGATAPPWWAERAGQIHDAASVVMFVMFAVFSLWLFCKTDQPNVRVYSDKWWRNVVFRVCGLAIVGSVGWVFYLEKTVPDPPGPSIFGLEWVAIGAFSVSWLVKGYALRTVARGARAVKHAVTGSRRKLQIN